VYGDNVGIRYSTNKLLLLITKTYFGKQLLYIELELSASNNLLPNVIFIFISGGLFYHKTFIISKTTNVFENKN